MDKSWNLEFNFDANMLQQISGVQFENELHMASGIF